MALPIVIPAIVKGAAALSAALGLTALVSSKPDNDEDSFDTSRIKDALDPYALVKRDIPLMMAARAKMQQPTKTNIPTAENALVLKPEYRTETYVVPDQYNPIKAIVEVQDSQGNKKFVDDSNLYGSAEDVPDPKKPKKNDDKKPFWKTTPGKIVKWTLIGGGSAAALPWIGGAAYRYFSDYIPYALSKTINTSDYNNSSTEIDREGTEQAWEDMKVGRKPGQ